jgi:hypothetical protein
MITKDGRGEFTAECNDCGSEEYSGALDFMEFIEYLKEIRWAIRRVVDGNDVEYEHYCPDCKGV